MDNKKVALGDSPMTVATGEVATVLNSKERCALFARTAEDLSFVPDRSVDAIITDPPYYGNVMYAELSDFFYVWLRLALKDEYPEFSTPLVPKAREIVVNEKAKVGSGVKDDVFFRQGLLRCFKECNRVLKDDGLLTFTFHHEKPKAWAAVLDAVLQASFNIRRVWTYHSESPESIHRHGIRFDTVIVARKRDVGPAPEASWQILQDEIVAEVQEELRRLLGNGAGVGSEDVFVITMGKALAVYSRHYPKVMHTGQPVKLEQAIDDIESLVDEQIDAYFGMVVPAGLDSVSRIYLQTLAHRQVISRDALVKVCLTRRLDFAVFEQRQLIRRGKKAGLYEVLQPESRRDYLEAFWGQGFERQPSVEPLPIDRAHWLYITYKAGRSLHETVPQIYQRGLQEACDALAKITRDNVYQKIAEQIRQFKDQGRLI